jgi:hypothetical protein
MIGMRSRLALLALVVAAAAVPAAAQTAARPTARAAAPLELGYTVRMPEPATHLYAVTVAVGNLGGRESVDLHVPVWTPGSYLVREFERHVQDFAATAGGAPARWQKVDKNTWRVWPPRGATSFEATYRVYANELTVRTSHLDDTHGYFNGANLFMYADESKASPARLTVFVPRAWDVATALERAGAPEPAGETVRHTFSAPDYDTLVDSPVETGLIRKVAFEALGRPHEISIWGRGNENVERLAADVKKIVGRARPSSAARCPTRATSSSSTWPRAPGAASSTPARPSSAPRPSPSPRRSPTAACSPSSPTSTSTRGSSSASAPSRSARSTTRTRTTRGCCG